MARCEPASSPIPATTGVQPGAPNAKHRGDHDLADGPPATDDVVATGPTDDE